MTGPGQLKIQLNPGVELPVGIVIPCIGGKDVLGFHLSHPEKIPGERPPNQQLPFPGVIVFFSLGGVVKGKGAWIAALPVADSHLDPEWGFIPANQPEPDQIAGIIIIPKPTVRPGFPFDLRVQGPGAVKGLPAGQAQQAVGVMQGGGCWPGRCRSGHGTTARGTGNRGCPAKRSVSAS